MVLPGLPERDHDYSFNRRRRIGDLGEYSMSDVWRKIF